MVSHPETGSDSPIGSDQYRGCDTAHVEELMQERSCNLCRRAHAAHAKELSSDQRGQFG